MCTDKSPKAFVLSAGIQKLPITWLSVDNFDDRVLCCKPTNITHNIHGCFLCRNRAIGWFWWISGLRAVAMWSSSSFTKIVRLVYLRFRTIDWKLHTDLQDQVKTVCSVCRSRFQSAAFHFSKMKITTASYMNDLNSDTRGDLGYYHDSQSQQIKTVWNSVVYQYYGHSENGQLLVTCFWIVLLNETVLRRDSYRREGSSLWKLVTYCSYMSSIPQTIQADDLLKLRCQGFLTHLTSQ